MALIKCSECGKAISDKSKVCVNCGNPIQKAIKKEKEKKEKSKAFKIIVPIAITIIVFIIGIISFIFINKYIEHYKENEILKQIEGTWLFSEKSKANGGTSYDIITFTENKTFKATSGFIFEGKSIYKYGYHGKMSIYYDGEIWLYADNDKFVGHFIYDKEYDELYERNDEDGSQKQYFRND